MAVIKDHRQNQRRRRVGRLKLRSADTAYGVFGDRVAGALYPYLRCTVAVMPGCRKPSCLILTRRILRIDTFRSSGAGGRHVNTATPLSVLPTCRPASWWNAGTSVRSIKTKRKRSRCSGQHSRPPKRQKRQQASRRQRAATCLAAASQR